MSSRIQDPLSSLKNRRSRWHQISNDPNALEVLAARRDALTSAQAGIVEDRITYLCELVRGKRILDVGVVDHFLDASSSERWLHGKLCEVAKECVGVDVLTEELEQLRLRGYDVRNADLTRGHLDETFDIIVMGEIIEHIEQPGNLLRNAAMMLDEGGVAVLTTPNPWYVNVIIKNFLDTAPFTESADHVSWYDASTLYEMGQRCGLQLYRYTGVRDAAARTLLGRALFRIAPFLITLRLNQLLFAKTIIYEFRRYL
jgi:2-polyprenyl-3-methyl-5-hydroxy-6-metoxy-1,4-benzoquinol methylase